MNILDYYKFISDNKETKDIYHSTGDVQTEGKGKIFSFFNTNYRTIFDKKGENYTGFAVGFSIINKVVGKPYNEWQRYENNENMFKQHTVRMRKSDLFSVKDGIYSRTKRGDVFDRMLKTNENELSVDEKRLICLILILSGHFSNTQNYIYEKTKEVFKSYNQSGYTDEDILKIQKDFLINSKGKKKEEVLKMDYTYIHSFCFQYKDIDFNKLFKISSEKDKTSLKEYILANLKAKNRKCVLSHKYEGGGVYTVSMLRNSTTILYVVKKLIDYNVKSFEDFIDKIISFYSELYEIKRSSIYDFITCDENKGVFHRIFTLLYDIKQEKMVIDSNVKCVNLNDNLKIDTTDETGAKENDAFSEALKKLVKVNADYKCIMEDIENCKYFTSKESNQNYLEVHHLIPRAFANDFDESIENKDNYIPLCPNCHRKIHLAVDSERKHLINYIYNQRKQKLIEDKIIPQNAKVEDKDFLKVLYDYYKVTD